MLSVDYSDYMRPLISILPFLLLISHNLYAAITPGSVADGTEGINYPSVTFTSDQVRAGDPSVRWKTLNEPPGITIDNKGKYVGKPTKAGNYSVTVTVSIVQGTRLILKDSISIPHSINSTVAPVINQIALPRAKFDARYQPTAGFRLTATGGVPYPSNSHFSSGYKWEAITDGNEFKRLPAGMNLSSAGVISGVPTSLAPKPASLQTYFFKVKITDLAGKSDIKTFTLIVDPADPPEIVTQCPLPEGLELFNYTNFTLRGSKGKPPYTWTIDPVGNFAPGLRLDNKTGVISGKPTRYGTYNFTLVLRDANGFAVNKTCSINIRPAPEIIVKPIFACARVGGSACDEIEARGGDQPYAWTVTGYPGLTINATSSASKARICGNFTQAGNFTISVTARDRTGRVDIEQFSFRVWPPLSFGDECPLETGVQNSPYQKDLQAGGGKPPYNWALVPPNRGLPPGLTLNSSTGRIAGTPTQSGSYPFAYKVTDSCGNSLTTNCSITINPPLSTPTCNQLCLYDGLALNGDALFSVSGGKPPYTWSQATGLPPNLTLSSNGSLSGTINATGNYTVTANVTDRLGNSKSASCVISVHPRLTISTPSPLPTAFSNSTYSITINATGGKPNPNYIWSHVTTNLPAGVSANLPPGLTFLNGVLSGTPTQSGSFKFRIQVADQCGNIDFEDFTLQVSCALTLSITSTNPTSSGGSDGTATVIVGGGSSPFKYELFVVGSSLPLQSVTKPQQSHTFTGLQFGVNYLAKVQSTNDSGCESEQEFSLPQSAINFDADYVMLTYEFRDGLDLDTHSELLGMGNLAGGAPQPIGWNRPGGSSQPGSNPFFFWGGDNTGTGFEAFYIDLIKLRQFHPTINEIAIDCRGRWHAARGSQPVKMVAKFFKGGIMTHSGFTFVNPSAVSVGALDSFDKQINLQTTNANLNDRIAIFTYNLTTKVGRFFDTDTWPIATPSNLNSLNSFYHQNSINETSQNSLVDNYVDLEIASNDIVDDLIDNLPNLRFLVYQTEVTIADYLDFLNAVGFNDDFGIYSPEMANLGVIQTGSAGAFSYSAEPDYLSYPITYVSWFDAARYANWLANGKPSGEQNSATTEDGAYKMASPQITRNAINPNTGAAPAFWLLNESEWYASAYVKSDASGVWTYPTQSNTVPDSSGANPSNFANFGGVFGETTLVGFFDQSPGPFGTFDQAGNVREWTETLDTSSGSPLRIIRGGSWADPSNAMRADESHIADPTLEDDKTGFRIGGAP